MAESESRKRIGSLVEEYVKEAVSRYVCGVKETDKLRAMLSGEVEPELEFVVAIKGYLKKNVRVDGVALKILREFEIDKEIIREIMDNVYYGNQINIRLREGQYVIPLGNPNCHNYTIGKVYRILNGEYYATNSNGWVGNHLPADRYAIKAASNPVILGFVIKEAYRDLKERLSQISSKPGVTLKSFTEAVKSEVKRRGLC